MHSTLSAKRLTLVALYGALLAACGGGGGGGGGAGSDAPTLANSAAQVPLSGRVTYDAVPPGSGGALNYEATAPKPVRGAQLEVLELGSGALVAAATTDETGRYDVSVPDGLQVIVRVRAQSSRTGASGRWDMSVRDNTQGNAIHAMESPAFLTGSATPTRDLHAPSGWGGTRYDGTRVAAPFAILDTIYAASNLVLSVEPGAQFPPLNVFWSAQNAPSPGQVSLGQIGTSSYTRDRNGVAAIYVLGKENVDTDEYDASVIAHEWGHYYQGAFSRDDSPGGPHGVEERLDIRLAFSEGWGNAWSGMLVGRPQYIDSVGPAQSMATVLDLTDPGAPGWFDERTVQSLLWRLHAQRGFAPIHRAFAGGLRQTPALVTIHAFAAAYVGAVPEAQSELSAMLANQGISGATNSPWAELESNAGGLPGVLPIYRPAQVGAPATACITTAAGAPNKLGNYAYMRYTIAATRNYRLTVTGPAGTDPDLGVFTTSGQIASAIAFGASDALQTNLPAGDIVVALNDANNAGSNCFQLELE